MELGWIDVKTFQNKDKNDVTCRAVAGGAIVVTVEVIAFLQL